MVVFLIHAEVKAVE